MIDALETPQVLRNVPLINTLEDLDLQRIIDSPRTRTESFGPKQRVVREDEIADCMYVVLDGTLNVSIRNVDGREVTVATLRAGDFFGEQALLPEGSGRRNASVYALTGATLLRIDREEVVFGISHDAGAAHDLTAAESLVQNVRNLLKGVRLLQAVPSAELDHFPEWSELVEFEPGEMIMREGQSGDCMFIILHGRAEVFVMDGSGTITVIATLTRGNYFGEQALLPAGTGIRNASVRTRSNSKLLKISRKHFNQILERDRKLQAALAVVGAAQKSRIREILQDHAERSIHEDRE